MWRIASVFWLLVGFGVDDAYGRIVPDGRAWRIWTKTSNKEHAGTNADVHIILIDPDGGESPPLFLDNILRNDFQQNSVDQFSVYDQVNLKDVCAIRIYRDNSGSSPDWFLEKVWMKTAEMINDRVFNVKSWVPTKQEEMESYYEVQRTPPCSAGPLE
ncbi:lipoxygenase homology domain-containing protein 1-like [Pomacea canaliculata]|uniref:lipoxygenase homology domain-containing protein 1-like n=1 Tax=Pomacea canaliculata TaxID=400727 RepID=UPI000D730E43|nr:lipoxygenase homology domain-containing protein 1-like [Pomacea canaliculata]